MGLAADLLRRGVVRAKRGLNRTFGGLFVGASAFRAVSTVRRSVSMLVAATLVSCSGEPPSQVFGTGFPEPARGLSYVAGGRCSLDFVTATPTERGWRTDTAKPIRFSGWALEDVAQPASPWVVIELAAPGDRARYFAATTFRSPRTDLFAVLGDGPGVRNAAFELVASADALPRGPYTVRVLMRGAAGGLTCNTGKVLELA
jgi:hypothetical protein